MKKALSMLLTVALLMGTLAGCGSGGASKTAPAATTSAATPTSNSGKVINVRLGFAESTTSPHYKGYQKIAENLKRDSKGLLKVTLYPSNQLGSERDLYEGCQIGSVEAMIVTNSTLDAFIPGINVLDEPFMFDTAEQAHKVIDGKLGDKIKELSAAKGVQIVGWCDSGFRDIYSAKEIKSVDDLKGLKIRTMESDVQIAAYNSLGCIATPMAFGDLFTALQQHTVDAYENSVANCYANRFYEVCKYGIRSSMQFAFQGVCISNKIWDQIPGDLKPKILEGIKEGCEVQRQALADGNAADVKLLEKQGMKFSDIDRTALAAKTKVAMSKMKFDSEWQKLFESELAAAK